MGVDDDKDDNKENGEMVTTVVDGPYMTMLIPTLTSDLEDFRE